MERIRLIFRDTARRPSERIKNPVHDERCNFAVGITCFITIFSFFHSFCYKVLYKKIYSVIVVICKSSFHIFCDSNFQVRQAIWCNLSCPDLYKYYYQLYPLSDTKEKLIDVTSGSVAAFVFYRWYSTPRDFTLLPDGALTFFYPRVKKAFVQNNFF